MGLDVIDFTDLQKRGLLKTEKIQDSPDTIDFTSSNSEEQDSYFASSSSTGLPTVNNEQSNPFDLLSSLAQAGDSNNNSSTNTGNSDLHLKLDTIVNKLEDTMYKIENLSSRILALESKIESRTNPFSGR